MIFGIDIIDADDNSEDFFVSVKKRLSVDDFVKNPFKSHYVDYGVNYKVLSLDSPYPKVWKFGLLLIIAGLIFFGINLNALMIGGIIIFIVGLFIDSKLFFKSFILFGLRKKGFRGRIVFVSDELVIKRLLGWDK